jgi:uncharacterized protein YjbJ (UPF0337 family)
VGSRSAATPRVIRTKEKYETQYERQDQGQLPRSRGEPIKEEVGKVTKDRDLKAKGRAEKKGGEVQQRIGRAKEKLSLS